LNVRFIEAAIPSQVSDTAVKTRTETRWEVQIVSACAQGEQAVQSRKYSVSMIPRYIDGDAQAALELSSAISPRAVDNRPSMLRAGSRDYLDKSSRTQFLLVPP
jgi:hypothetical protein